MNDGKGMAGQVGAALVLALAVVAVVLFVQGREETAAPSGKPAACNPPKDTDAPGYPALCAALNRPDLPALVGVPGEHVVNAYSAGLLPSEKGAKGRDAAVEVQVGSYNVRLADNGDLSLRTVAEFLTPKVLPGSVLGHPAATYTDHTMSISFGLAGSKSSAGTGGIAQHLVVSKGQGDGVGSYEIAVWRQDAGAVDDAAARRIAETVLPTLQGWVSGQQ
ncbi:DUF6215 domain-containing protein [Kitasatospora sp. NPDC093558]|uniref:DUF6215 domain-containing protein n=1 Tax=Kitasatospora sp. NPDC093558 TaxID=3155201 RepID=UPI003431033F